MKHVKVGVGFGLWRLGMPSTAQITQVAEQAEDWGLDSFWLSDHLLSPSPELDVVATLSLIASRTSKIKLGPSVLLLNLRHPLLVAKSFASLDYFSNGRMVMAVGTGSNLADYTACGIPPESRGSRLNEGIEVLRLAWSQPDASYHGKFYDFEHVTLDPRPVARTNNDSGTIDIWVGGRSDGALKRTGRLADGYFASFRSPDEFARGMATIREYAAAAGRANARIESGLILLCRMADSRERALEDMKRFASTLAYGENYLLERSAFGTAEDVIECVDKYVKIGLDKFVLWPVARPEEWTGQVERIGREIAAHYAHVGQAA